MTSMKKRISTVLAAGVLAAALAVPAQAVGVAGPIRVSSYKGCSLTAGETSGLIIGPDRVEYAVASSDPTVIQLTKVLGY